MRRSIVILLSALISFSLFLLVERAFGADNRTTVENKNTPVPSAISPSVQSYSQVICSFPVNAGMQTSVIGISGGTGIFIDGSQETPNADPPYTFTQTSYQFNDSDGITNDVIDTTGVTV